MQSSDLKCMLTSNLLPGYTIRAQLLERSHNLEVCKCKFRTFVINTNQYCKCDNASTNRIDTISHNRVQGEKKLANIFIAAGILL